MKHLIVSREYPPAPGGGIGTYVLHLSRLLARSGEEVHVIGAQWEGAEKPVEELEGGRLVVHRVPFRSWKERGKPNPAIDSKVTRSLFESGCDALAFGFQASLLAERLVEEEGIELVEGQEFEAPLYFFQLRRALGAKARRTAPCLVHLHSPTEIIIRHNQWDLFEPYYQLSKRCEDYSIQAADALLCPSRYLAREAEALYRLPAGAVETIPLPMGDDEPLERTREVWRNGTIVFVGRLEPRKGIIEWVEAAASVAPEFPEARFEFIGGSTRGARKRALLSRIPPQLRSRFLFRGERPRSAVRDSRAGARLAVVPSRWENFPYTCQEAMASGLPVIASPCGGMVEMITDGRSGFIAKGSSPSDLAEALRRALATPPEVLAGMGRAAVEDIRRLCDPERIVDLHLRFRSRIAKNGASASLRLPCDRRAPVERVSPKASGIAVVLTGDRDAPGLARTLASVAGQRRLPASVALALDGAGDSCGLEPIEKLRAVVPGVVEIEGSGVWARGLAVQSLLDSGPRPLGFAFLEPGETIAPDLVATAEKVLAGAPGVGVVSFWSWQPDGEHLWIRLAPRFPHQWLSNEASPMSVVRTEALLAAGGFRSEVAPALQQWDLVNAILVAGWSAVTVPEPLGSLAQKHRDTPWVLMDDEQRRGRNLLLSRFPEVVTGQLSEIVALAQSVAFRLKETEHAIWKSRWTPRGLARRVRNRWLWMVSGKPR